MQSRTFRGLTQICHRTTKVTIPLRCRFHLLLHERSFIDVPRKCVCVNEYVNECANVYVLSSEFRLVMREEVHMASTTRMFVLTGAGTCQVFYALRYAMLYTEQNDAPLFRFQFLNSNS